MQTMTPMEMYDELDSIVRNGIMDPLMIVGPSGIGKSQVAGSVSSKHSLTMYDIRWGQLSLVDARGCPVVNRDDKSTEFFAPKMWPREGPALIFLDEFNMATPVMMGLGQQLLLDRQFGDYRVPDGVFIWAAGNRKTDRAFVNEVPAPVKNRVAHYSMEPDLDAWCTWAFGAAIDPRIIGFLKWRPELLHKFDPNAEGDAWPSPRTWVMADRRLKAGMAIEPVVGECESEFFAYVTMAGLLLDLERIAEGHGAKLPFPEEMSMKYACVSGLMTLSLKNWATYRNCFVWIASTCADDPEWVQMFVMDIIKVLNRSDKRRAAEYMEGLNKLPEAQRYIQAYVSVLQASKK